MVKAARRGGALLITSAFMLTACGAPTTTPEVSIKPWEEIVKDTVAAAQRLGASPEQIATLAEGEVTFGSYEAAVTKAISCMREAGIDVVNDRVTSENGYPEISYSYAASSPGRTEAETTPISDLCITTHSMFIESLYRESPQVQEVVDARFTPFREAALDCLKESGRSVPTDASRAVIEQVNTTLVISGGKDCMQEIGFH